MTLQPSITGFGTKLTAPGKERKAVYPKQEHRCHAYCKPNKTSMTLVSSSYHGFILGGRDIQIEWLNLKASENCKKIKINQAYRSGLN
jgi:hypothetical protein